MKKLLALFVVLAVAACSSGDDKPDPNAPTTFVFEQTIDNVLQNCVAGYYADGLCHKIAELGDLSNAGQQTEEIIIEDDSITEIYLFTERYNPAKVFRRSFPIKKNIKNVFKLLEDDRSNLVDMNDPTQYPH